MCLLILKQTKLRKATDQIHVLETKLQQTLNENTKLKVKQKEDTKLWGGLDSKVSSTNTICDQLTETLQQLAGQTCAGINIVMRVCSFNYYHSHLILGILFSCNS